jgi:hypothetical protein
MRPFMCVRAKLNDYTRDPWRAVAIRDCQSFRSARATLMYGPVVAALSARLG